jgi:hypothetical protein
MAGSSITNVNLPVLYIQSSEAEKNGDRARQRGANETAGEFEGLNLYPALQYGLTQAELIWRDSKQSQYFHHGLVLTGSI